MYALCSSIRCCHDLIDFFNSLSVIFGIFLFAKNCILIIKAASFSALILPYFRSAVKRLSNSAACSLVSTVGLLYSIFFGSLTHFFDHTSCRPLLLTYSTVHPQLSWRRKMSRGYQKKCKYKKSYKVHKINTIIIQTVNMNLCKICYYNLQ